MAAPEREQLSAMLVELVQRLSVIGQRLGHAFASRQGLHPTDLEALLHVMHAERHRQPMSAGALGRALGLSSGAVTGVIDRLERAGHVERRRGDRARRRVVLHHSAAGQAVAGRFFGPLGRLHHEVTEGYTSEELQVVVRYLTELTERMAGHLDDTSAEE